LESAHFDRSVPEYGVRVGWPSGLGEERGAASMKTATRFQMDLLTLFRDEIVQQKLRNKTFKY
jgi:hypothetical protein